MYESNEPDPDQAKLNTDMDFDEYRIIMSGGELWQNPPRVHLGSNGVIKRMPYIDYVLLHHLDNYGIRDVKLYCLFTRCCKEDYNLFRLTMQMIGDRRFSQADINDNLNTKRLAPFFVPFIDDEIYKKYDKEGFAPHCGKVWDDFCKENVALFQQRIDDKRQEEEEYYKQQQAHM